jgi:lipid-binding SYLF domain-containing protein
MKRNLIFLITSLFLLAACSTMTTSEKEKKRSDLDVMADASITRFVEQDASMQEKIDNSLAYAVINVTLTKVPLVGAGGGEGVTFDKKTKNRTYITATRLDLGGGVGARAYKLLILINTEEVYEKFKGGTWEFSASAEAAAGTTSEDTPSGETTDGDAVAEEKDLGLSTYELSEGGAVVYVSARVIRTKVNHALTDND